MLANQVVVPDVNVAKEPATSREVKGNAERTADRDFDKVMQENARQQQQYQQQQSQRQDDANAKDKRLASEANADRAEQKQQAANKKESASERNVSSKNQNQDTNKSQQENRAENEDKTASNRDDEHCSDHQSKNAKDTQEAKVSEHESTEKVDDSEVDKAALNIKSQSENETSKWLDTILQIASGNKTDANTEQTISDSAEQLVQGSQLINLSQLSDSLNELDIEIPASLSQIDSENVTLDELKQLLSPSELDKLVSQLNEHKADSKADSTLEKVQTFITLLTTDNASSNASENTSSNTETAKTSNDKPSLEQLLQQLANKPDEQIATNNKIKEAADTPIQLSSLMSNNKAQEQITNAETKARADAAASRLSTNSLNQGSDSIEPNVIGNAKGSIEGSTKVIDFGLTESNKSAQKSATTEVNQMLTAMTSADNQIKTQNNDVDVPQEFDMSELATSKAVNILAGSESSEIKTSDIENKQSKVNVAGVTLDKTLQMPKLENVTQAKNEVVVRENILFNKQELANQMQTQVGLMMAKNMKSVDIRLDPPELGSMQVRLSVQNDQASVSFVVSNSQAKDALEQSLPKLKEMLEEQGLQLADSDVNQGEANGGQADDDENNGDVKANGLNQEQVDDVEQQQQMLNRQINSPWNVSYYA